MTSAQPRVLSYVPGPLRRSPRLQQVCPWSEPLHGAVLFADISGFTALTQQAAEQGPEGTERLSDLLYSVFGQIDALVHNYHGDIIEYAGDAIIALFRAEDSDPAQATGLAAACAHALPAVLRAASSDVELNIRSGIATGHMLAASVGGASDRRLYLIGGPPLESATGACATAARNEVILDISAARLVSGPGTSTPQASGAVRLDAIDVLPPEPRIDPLPTDPDLLETLGCYVPRSVLLRTEHMQDQWLAELRFVSVLFACIDGIDYARSNVLQHLQEGVLALQKAVYRYDGDVLQLLADDKGTVAVATWGLPGFTHEDDPSRAVAAALQMRDDLQQSGLSAHIGVTRGQVFCGERGGDRRRDYAMLGNTVNLAARLMQSATNSVLCDEYTVAACKTNYTFEPIAEVQVKGFHRPIKTSTPRAVQQKHVPQGEGLIGRSAEIARLDALVGSNGGRQAVVLVGEAGIGKSVLLGRTIGSAQQSGRRCLIGIADVNERSTPYYVWRPILLSVLGRPGGTDADLHDTLNQQLRDVPHLAAHSSLLSAALGIQLAESAQTRQLTARRRAEVVRELVVHLMDNMAADGPLLLVLDDVHWIDTATWGLVRAVFERIDGLRLLMASRPADDTSCEDEAELRQSPGVETLELQPLNVQEILDLVAHRLEIETLPPDLAEFIKNSSGGNPFFAQELISAMREEGHIRIDGGRCHITAALSELQVPATVQGVVAGRIDRLESDVQMTMKVASVVGRLFEQRTVYSVHPIAERRSFVASHLAQLVARDLTQPEAPEPEPSYLFRHVITQEVTYDLLSFAQRRKLHAAVAQWYEQTHAEQASAFYPLLAQHWARAEEASRAIHYYQLAGEQAVFAYANREAIRFFDKAETMAAKDDTAVAAVDRSRWHWLAGRAYLQLADNANSRRHLQRSLALIGQGVPSSRLGLAVAVVGQIARIFWTARTNQQDPQKAGETQLSLTQAAGVHHDLGEIAYFDNNLLALVYSAVRAMNLAVATGEPAVVARSYTTACVAVANAGFADLARRYRERAATAAEATDDLAARAYCYLGCGLFHSGVGEWQQIEELTSGAADIFARIGDRYRWEMVTNQRAYALLHQGKFQPAREMLEATLASVTDDSLQVPIIAVSGLVLIDLADAEVNTAMLSKLETLAARADEMAQPSDAILAHGVLALAALNEGKLDAAWQAAKNASRRIRFAPPPSFYTYRSVAAIGEVALERCRTVRLQADDGHKKQLDRSAVSSLKNLSRFARFFPIAKPRLERLRADLALIQGKPELARRYRQQAMSTARQMDMPYELKLTELQPDATDPLSKPVSQPAPQRPEHRA